MVHWSIVLAILGNVAFLCLLAWELQVIWSIWKKKSSDDCEGPPFLLIFLVCATWLIYSLSSPRHPNMAILIAAVSSMALQLLFISLFIIYASTSSTQKHFGQLLLVVLVLLALEIIIGAKLLHKHKRKTFFGVFCAGFSVIFYTSHHVTIMKHVLLKKEQIKEQTCLFSFLIFVNSVAWSFYGVFTKDKFVEVSSGIGSFLGAGQLVLFLVLYIMTCCQSQPPITGTNKTTANKNQIYCQDPIFSTRPNHQGDLAIQNHNEVYLPT